MAETIRDVVINIRLAQLDAALKAPDTSDVRKTITGFGKHVAETTKSMNEGFTSTQEPVATLAGEVEKLNAQLEAAKANSDDAAAVMTSNATKVSDGFVTAGTGAFTLARGIAFIGTSSEDEFSKVVLKIAKIQGAFDVFKGGTAAVKGLVKGTRALNVVLAGTAVRNTAVATTNTAVATTGAAATVSMGALTLALGPIAIGLAAMAAAFYFFKEAPDDIDATADAAKRAENSLKNLETTKSATLEKMRSRASERVALSRIRSLKEEEGLTLKLFNIDTLRWRSSLDLKKNVSKIIGLKKLGLDKPFAAPLSENSLIDIVRKEANVSASQGTKDSVKESIELQKLLGAHLENAVSSEEKRLAVLDKETASLKRNLQTEKSRLETAKSILATEKQRIETFAETFARLDPARRSVLRGIGKKIKGGEDLDRGELSFLASSGGQAGKDFESKKQTESGLALGSNQVLQNISGRQTEGKGSLTQTKTKEVRDLDSTIKSIGEVAAEVAEKRDAQYERLEAVMLSFFATKSDIERLTLALTKAQQNNNR